MLGACIGSFLNVVIYRLPRGQSLVRPGSRCPRCGGAIRAYHNLPVFGWLILRGRCHDCGARISWRYPLVEATTALLFVALAWLVYGVAADGRPAVADLRRGGLYVGLLVATCSLIGVAAIAWDRQRVSPVLYVTLAVGLAVTGAGLWSLMAG
ncbi:MAG: hypothetical protein GTO03_03890 [Planctomycetales bacterium]|nr:hypothetical protein [Planctomycetales bacterium]